MSELEKQQQYLQDRWALRFQTDPSFHAEVKATIHLLAAIEDTDDSTPEAADKTRMTAFYLVANLWEGRAQRARGFVSAEAHMVRRRREEAELAALGQPEAYTLADPSPELSALLGLLDEANRWKDDGK